MMNVAGGNAAGVLPGSTAARRPTEAESVCDRPSAEARPWPAAYGSSVAVRREPKLGVARCVPKLGRGALRAEARPRRAANRRLTEVRREPRPALGPRSVARQSAVGSRLATVLPAVGWREPEASLRGRGKGWARAGCGLGYLCEVCSRPWLEATDVTLRPAGRSQSPDDTPGTDDDGGLISDFSGRAPLNLRSWSRASTVGPQHLVVTPM